MVAAGYGLDGMTARVSYRFAIYTRSLISDSHSRLLFQYGALSTVKGSPTTMPSACPDGAGGTSSAYEAIPVPVIVATTAYSTTRPFDAVGQRFAPERSEELKEDYDLNRPSITGAGELCFFEGRLFRNRPRNISNMDLKL